MDILIVGGSYFVGRSIVAHLIGSGHRIAVLNRGTRPVAGGEQLIADRNDTASMRNALAGRRFDAVADLTSRSRAHVDSLYDALGGRFARMLYISSAAVYAEDGRFPMAETHPVGPSAEWGDYGLEKLASERRLAERSAERPLFVLRPPYIYGPGNTAPREHWLWARLLAGRPILIPELGETPLQFLHADDLGRAVECALESDAASALHVYNVGHSDWVSVREYLEILARVSGTDLEMREVPYPALGVRPREFFPFRDYACVLDVAKIRSELSWEPSRALELGLAQTFQHCDRERLTEHLDTAAEDALLSRLEAPL